MNFSERNETIIRLHVDEGLTLAEIGRLHGITRERARQIVTRGIGETLTRSRWKEQRQKAHAQAAAIREQKRVYQQSIRWILDRVEIDENGCWIWQNALYPTGYGACGDNRGGGYAHRASWEIANGAIPEGLTLDHLCRVRACVNPDHLDPCTLGENVMRSPIALAAINARKTHCVNGHAFDDDNTRFVGPNRHRKCRACGRDKQRKGGVSVKKHNYAGYANGCRCDVCRAGAKAYKHERYLLRKAMAAA